MRLAMSSRQLIRYLKAICIGILLAYLLAGRPFLFTQEGAVRSDFTGYYTAGRIVDMGFGKRLYNLELQKAVQAPITSPHVVMREGVLPFEYPAFAVFPFIPLAFLPHVWAARIWTGLNLSLLLVVLYAAQHSFREVFSNHDVRQLWWLAAFSFLPVFASLLQGQLSILVFLFLFLAVLSLRQCRDTSSGFWLAAASVKPQLVVVILLTVLFKRRWKVLIAYLAGVAILGITSLAIVGMDGMKEFMLINVAVHSKRPLTLNLSILGGAVALLGSNNSIAAWAVTLVIDLLLLFLLAVSWRGPWPCSKQKLDLQLALAFLVSLLVSPHLYFHDLILLLLPAILILSWCSAQCATPKERWIMGGLLGGGYLCVLLGFEAPYGVKIPVAYLLSATLLLFSITRHAKDSAPEECFQ